MAFKITPYEIPGLLLVEGPMFPDERGHFMESFRAADFKGTPLKGFVQDNLSRSHRGVMRGLHYQKNPSAIGKLVRCVRGKILDVVVDIRVGSPTFGKHASIELSDEANRMFWVPPGFAHGFYTLSDIADVHYKVTGYWVQKDDRGILWNDPALGIQWPKSPSIVAAKDAAHPPLAKADNNFTWP